MWTWPTGLGGLRSEPASGVLAMANTVSPLTPLLDEINRAASGGFPFLAVAMAVALPDICCSLIYPDGRSKGVRYRAWCKANLGPEFDFVTSKDLYSIRCGVLHSGRFGDLEHNVASVKFILPGTNINVINSRLDDIYLYSVVDFCKNFTASVEAWFEKNKHDPNVVANLPRLMRYRPDGLKPIMAGITVLE
jgi:hypothetical protein